VSLFDCLVIAHVVGDWLLQTEWQALNKASNWRAMAAHVAVYHAIVLIALILRLGWADVRVYLVVAGLALTHAWLDRDLRTIWIMKKLRIIETRTPERWLTIAVDQAIHLVLLALASLCLS
jgi:hypothetical protein